MADYKEDDGCPIGDTHSRMLNYVLLSSSAKTDRPTLYIHKKKEHFTSSEILNLKISKADGSS